MGATHSSSPNFGFEYCLRPGKIRPDETEGLDLRSLRLLMNGSEPVRPDTRDRFIERLDAIQARDRTEQLAS